jgi:thiol-disulfide isomerase/thioredoxin
VSPGGGTAVALVALLAATVAGLYWRRRNGRVLPLGPASGPAFADGPLADQSQALAGQSQAPAEQSQALAEQSRALAALGVAPGRTTLLQFSSAFCAPCRVARRVCADVAAALDVVHLEVDAESHLDAVRRLGIWRTPTVLVVDPTGRVTHRVSGPPAKAELLAAIG